MTTTTQPLTTEQSTKLDPRERNRHLQRLRRARAAQAKAQERLDAADNELRQLICDGFDMGIPGSALADAAGVSKPRTYQIRDGR